MTNSIASATDADELQLATLICTRMARRLQGLLSVGLSFVHYDGPYAQSFLQERFPEIEAHARVLFTINGRLGPTIKCEHLQEQSKKVLDAMQQLGRYIAQDEAFRKDYRPILYQMRLSFIILYDALAGYARLLGIDMSPIERMKSICLPIFDYLDRTPTVAEEKLSCISSTRTYHADGTASN